MSTKRWSLLVAALWSWSASTFAAPPKGSGVRGKVQVQAPSAGAEALPLEADSIVVYLTGFETPPRNLQHRMDQRDKTFLPRVLPIVKGESVVFANGDPLLHNVFSRSRAKEFDLGKNRQGETQTVKFDKTGVVDVYCDIHESMSATVLVLPNAAFARVDGEGRYEIPGVPAGTYTVYAWQRNGEPTRQSLIIPEGTTVEMNLQLDPPRAAPVHLDKRGRPYKQRATY